MIYITSKWKKISKTEIEKYVYLYKLKKKKKIISLETVNNSISKKVETFVMFLYFRNGKYLNNFIY